MTYQFVANLQMSGEDADRLYQSAFGYKEDGFFIEVGASNGLDYSFTCELARLGWAGIYIEPVPELAEQCRRNHGVRGQGSGVRGQGQASGVRSQESDASGHMTPDPCLLNPGVNVLCCAIGEENICAAEAWKIPDWGTATTNRNAVAHLEVERFLTSQLTLDVVLDANDAAQRLNAESNHQSSIVNPKSIDLLVIDVDFGEIAVLKGFTIEKWQPKLVIIELHEKAPEEDWRNRASRPIREFAEGYFARAGYEKVYADSINTCYVNTKPRIDTNGHE